MSAVMTDSLLPHRITVDEYFRMFEEKIISPDARVELIEGVIIDMAPIGPPHNLAVMMLNRLLVNAFGDLALVLPQGSVRLSDFTMPEPDFAILKPHAQLYGSRHAGPSDIFLLIEVSDSSLQYDVGLKAALYARHGIPEYWIIDLKNSRLRLCRSPLDGGYTAVTTVENPTLVSPVMLPAVQIDLSAAFGGQASG
jgi:Uma2 family endonuclease